MSTETNTKEAILTILGIETSCDDTCVGIVNENKQILVNCKNTQMDHGLFGGVVPELAAMEHWRFIYNVCQDAMNKYDIVKKNDMMPINDTDLDTKSNTIDIWNTIDAIAVTNQPGLFGSLFVGVNFARGLSSVTKKPIIFVNHLLGHLLTARLSHAVEFPYLALLISGGHTIIALVKDATNYDIIGQTLDDAIGESFDKVAVMLGMKYPGGPQIEKLAKNGDSKKYVLPQPMKNQNTCNFSLSGLKTAVKLLLKRILNDHKISCNSCDIDSVWQNNICPIVQQLRCDVSAVFQRVIVDMIVDRLHKAMQYIIIKQMKISCVTCVGGAAANNAIRDAVKEFANDCNIFFAMVDHALCVDNAPMIAWAAIEQAKQIKK